MKTCFSLTMLLSSLILVSCIKVKKTELEIPKLKKEDPLKKGTAQAGYKCDLMGNIDNKEIFLKVSKEKGVMSLSFRDFTDADTITLIGANYGAYSLLTTFTMKENSDGTALEGEGLLLHDDPASLSDEGKVLMINGRLTIDKNMNGLLEQRFKMTKEDNSLHSTDFSELAKIENCEVFEARLY